MIWEQHNLQGDSSGSRRKDRVQDGRHGDERQGRADANYAPDKRATDQSNYETDDQEGKR